MGRRGLLVVLAGLLAVGTACSGTSGHESRSTTRGQASPHPSSSAAVSGSGSAPCGRGTAPTTYEHVVWVVLENHSYDELVGPPGSDAARRSPYLNRLAASCGLATNAWGVTHPSLPNYLAMVSGGTGGVTNDCGPTSCPQQGPTVFDQVQQAGGSWRVLAESMPSPCSRQDAGRYVARHNPPTYFASVAATCPRWDLPLGTTSSGRLVDMVRAGQLPSFLVVVPNQCHNTHDCPIGDGDRWLSELVPMLTTGPDYRKGRTALFVTWDEGSGGDHGEDCRATRSSSCHIVTAVVAPAVRPGARVDRRVDHYALLAATESMLGLDPLGQAAGSSTADLRAAFGI